MRGGGTVAYSGTVPTGTEKRGATWDLKVSAKDLTTDKELKNYQGEGSSYHFQATYTEQLVAGGSP